MLINGQTVVGLESKQNVKREFSTGMSLDFIRDLIHGDADPSRAYPGPTPGMVGVVLGASMHTAILADGQRAQVSTEQADVIRSEILSPQ